jgi:hypothetical protein
MRDPKPIRERFPPPWQLELVPGGYRVNARDGTALAYVYTGPQGLAPAEVQAIAKAITRLPDLMPDGSGHLRCRPSI